MTAAVRRWSLPLRALHWIMAALILGLLALGLLMTHLRFDLGTTFALYQWHKSIGVVVLLLWGVRLGTRAAWPAPPEETPAGWQRAAARGTHLLLYGLMLALPLSGWMLASASPLHLPTRPFNLFTLPDLVTAGPRLFAALEGVHAALAYGLLALVAVHVAGALKHRFVDRDGVMARMGF
ncbi:cytochrome b [Azorhizobium doebereinerae]|uniref:cytochrome b n=1 Tax=Azorhizobium doebereinerae TaxID=281091 RepID=UPI0004043C16|nr:cytochrome b/b6 domain-containing protein [Azorhizobium doebereinerae]